MISNAFRKYMAGAFAVGVSLLSSIVAADSCGVERPIKAIVGYGAGGGTDSYARILSNSISGYIDGNPMVVVNKPGGAQVAAMKSVLASEPDGLTLHVAAMGGELMTTMLRDHGIDWFEDFTPIAQFGETNQALVVLRSSGITSTQALIDYIKSRYADGKKTRWSHPGRGSVSHIGVTAFLDMNGLLEMTQDVPFKGGAETRNALISGEVDFSVNGAHQVPDFLDIVIPLGLLSDQRDLVVKDIPTLEEQGIPYVPTSSPIVLVAPKGVSSDFVNCMSSAVEKASKDETFIDLSKKSKQMIVYRNSLDTEVYLRKLAGAWAPIIAKVRDSLNQ